MAERVALCSSLAANVVLGLALHRTSERLDSADELTWYYRNQADENRLNRILIEKVESYGNLIVSKLPNTGDK